MTPLHKIRNAATPLKSSSGDVLSVGIIGAGEVATKMHLPVLTTFKNVRITYIADLNLEAALIAGTSFRIPGLAIPHDLNALPKTDVVLIAIPVGARMPFYEIFAERGTAVLAEKPLATSVSDAEKILRLYPDNQLACGFQRRMFLTVDIAKTAVAEKWFGAIRRICVSEGAMTTKTGTDARFYDDWSLGSGGILMDLGCHLLDLAFFISRATKVIVQNQRFVFDGRIDREVEAHLRFEGPCGDFDMEFCVSWLWRKTNTFEIHFDSCILSFASKPDLGINILDKLGRSYNVSLISGRRRATTIYQSFYLEWEAFFAGLAGKHTCELSACSCLPSIKAVEALYAAGKPSL